MDWLVYGSSGSSPIEYQVYTIECPEGVDRFMIGLREADYLA